MRLISWGCVVLSGFIVSMGCSASSDGGNTFDEQQNTGGTGGEDINATFNNGTNSGTGTLTEEPSCEDTEPDVDNDSDGFTDNQGDSNDCTPQINPGAYDYDGNNIDEDCNGVADDTETEADSSLSLDASDPLDGARAIGLYKLQSGDSWGVVSADWVKADGSSLSSYPVGHGILDGMGSNVNPQEGTKLLALSSGTARQPTDTGYQSVGGYDKGYTSGAPSGYPKESPSCPGVTTGTPHDSVGLRLKIRTPTNAKSFSFNLNFYTYEFPGYICSTYNDFFVAMLSPTPSGQTDGNISFDIEGNTLSVNAGFLEVCTAQTAGGKYFPCELGSSELSGTGFEGHAATGWLLTTAPVEYPGEEIDLMFAIWDSGDGILDSTILLDNFLWDVDETPTETGHVDNPD